MELALPTLARAGRQLESSEHPAGDPCPVLQLFQPPRFVLLRLLLDTELSAKLSQAI